MKISAQNVSQGLDAVPQPKQANNKGQGKGSKTRVTEFIRYARGVPPRLRTGNLGKKINGRNFPQKLTEKVTEMGGTPPLKKRT